MQATAEGAQPDRAAKADIVVVGAGQAGARTCLALRAGGHAGSILLLGAEQHAPYERPALSKRLLTDPEGSEPDWVQPLASYATSGVEFCPGATVTAIDRAARRVLLAQGGAIGYGTLILATGARPRPIAALEGGAVPLQYLRTLDDSRALRRAAGPGTRVVLAGGGLIGLELAAALTTLGCGVTVVEARDQIFARSLSRSVAGVLGRAHRARGVELVLGRTVQATEDGAGGRGVVVLDDGRRLAADLMVAAVGVVPNAELAQAAGLEVRDGIVVDEHARSSAPGIYAVGDVTFQTLRQRRLESWANANAQAEAAAAHILGQSRPCNQPEWFWTDQYDLNVQVLGRAEGEEVWRGDPESGRFSVVHLREGALVGLTAVNSGRDIAMARRAMAGAIAVDVVALADPARPLRDALQPARARAAS